MKSLKLLLPFLIFAFTGNAQIKTPAGKNTKASDTAIQPAKDTLQVEYKIYNRAMLFGDYMVAKDALFGLIVKL